MYSVENYSAFEDLGQKNKLRQYIFSVLHFLELQILVD